MSKQKKSLLAILGLPLALAMSSYACIRPKEARTILAITEVACVLVHDRLDDENELAKICGIAVDALPAIRDLVSARKSAASQKAAASPSSSGSH